MPRSVVVQGCQKSSTATIVFVIIIVEAHPPARPPAHPPAHLPSLLAPQPLPAVGHLPLLFVTSSDDEVQVVVPWYAHLKQSPVYEPALDIFSGMAHKSPPIDTKCTMLLDIVSRPLEEYFLRGTSQATDFEKLKKQCHTGWMSASGRNWVWTRAVHG
jgi:hypothetical protein